MRFRAVVWFRDGFSCFLDGQRNKSTGVLLARCLIPLGVVIRVLTFLNSITCEVDYRRTLVRSLDMLLVSLNITLSTLYGFQLGDLTVEYMYSIPQETGSHASYWRQPCLTTCLDITCITSRLSPTSTSAFD